MKTNFYERLQTKSFYACHCLVSESKISVGILFLSDGIEFLEDYVSLLCPETGERFEVSVLQFKGKLSNENIYYSIDLERQLK